MTSRMSTRIAISVCVFTLGLVDIGRASDPTVTGGGLVDGPLGLTSTLGFGATETGGSFQCVMAGRSGGFPFGPWSQVLQMDIRWSRGPRCTGGGIVANVFVLGQ